MTYLLAIHSFLRWIIVVVAAATLVRLFLAWQRRAEFGRVDRALTSTFSGLLDVQVLLGIVFLVWNGLAGAGFAAYRLGHGLTMLLAAVVAHVPMRWRNARSALRFRNSWLTVVGSLLLVILGVFILPGGWTR